MIILWGILYSIMKLHPHIDWYIGIDEAGRGPLAGPITLGFFAVTSHGIQEDSEVKKILLQVKDSKQLSEKQRQKMYSYMCKKISHNPHIKSTTVSISAQVIEQNGITFAIKEAISRGLLNLEISYQNTQVLLDGGLKAPQEYFQSTIVRGDQSEPLIAGASILAKVTRDHYMKRMHKKYPQYGFAQHKGYGTPQHYQAIRRHGICRLHRSSWIKTLPA